MRIQTAKRSGVFALVVARGRLCVSAVVLLACLTGSAPAVALCVVNQDCNDGLFCTVDICLAGQCFNNTQSCQDSTFCNGVEVCDDVRDLCAVACLGGGTCTNGICVGGSNPGVGCDPSITPIACPGGAFCSENLEACVECLSSADCGNPQLPFCDPSSGACVACFSNSQCSDGLLCDGFEVCDPITKTCGAGTPVQCPLNPPQFCSELFAGTCVECETSLDCSGSTFCNPKTCAAGACVNTPPPVCKRCQSANSVGDPCEADSDCNAGFTCTGAPTFCSDVVGRCVMCLADSNCNDINFCTRNVCSTLDFTCQFPQDGPTICAERNGFLFCNGPEVCVNQLGVCDPITGAGCCLPGTPPTVGDGVLCTIDSCDEQNDVIVHAPDDSFCADAFFCNGVETCNPANGSADGFGCVAGTNVDCSFLDADCRIAQCNELTDACVSTIDPLREGTICVNPNNCDAVDLCQSGACVGFPPGPNDPFRCVVLELKAQGAGPFNAGDILSVDLIARAEGCNTSSRCLSTEHPLSAISAILTWKPTELKLRASGPGNLNPIDPCDSLDPCFPCPANQYNWINSTFPFDCGTTGFNQPCAASGPANDGDAFYIALDQLTNAICSDGLPPVPACATEAGLRVTTFEFEILPGAQGKNTFVSFGSCAIEVPGASSKALSKLPPPPPLTANVTKRLVDATIVVAACLVSADCDDGDPCTEDTCVAGGTCISIPLCPTHPDPCIIRTCNPVTASCDVVPVACAPGEVCFGGDCFVGCSTVADCDDGLACTTDTCEFPSGATVGTCINTPDDTVCDTGLFCAQQRCDVALGCVPAHECISTTGNPCPNQATCDDVADNCGGCLVPTVAGIGPRYLSITPQDQGTTTLALQVVGKCTDPNVACVSSFVQSVCIGGVNNGNVCDSDANCPKLCEQGTNNGLPCTFDSDCPNGGTCVGSCAGFVLGAVPSFHPASFWGEVRVGGIEIHPTTEYDVHAVCDFGGVQVASAANSGTTFDWGDVNGDGVVNVFDITGVVDAVKQVPNAPVPFEGANVWPCVIDTRVNVTDVVEVVDAVKGVAYPCASTCP